MAAPAGNRYHAKPDAIRKSESIKLRLSATQKCQLQELAEDAEMGVSEYLRAKIEESVGCKILADIEVGS